MLKKGKNQIIFTNDDYLISNSKPRVTSTRGKNAIQPQTKIRKFDFAYKFRQFLRMALTKVILRGDQTITYIPQKGIIIGQQEKCRSLVNKVLDEFSGYKFKAASYISNDDLDYIDYWMQEGITVYRPGVIEIALQQLEKRKIFLEQCEDFRQKMVTNNIILLRVPRNKDESINALLNKIMGQLEANKKEKSQTGLQSSMGKSISMSENSFILASQENNQSIKMEPKTSTQKIEDSEESFNITENDSSLDRSSFNIYNVLKPEGKKFEQIIWGEQ